MPANHSVHFFDQQFQCQVIIGDLALNPFEELALPYLRGRVLDFGCGMGNLAVAAAKRGCSVVALDASAAAISYLQRRATEELLAVEASQVDLRYTDITESFDTIVSIGLLAFFDRPTALRRLANLQARVREGGIAVVNVLIEGTTYMDMFDAEGYCLFSPAEIKLQFAGWTILHSGLSDFDAPDQKIKSFVTLIAQKPIIVT